MKKIVTKVTITLLSTSILISSNLTLAEDKASDRYIYIGSELGISEPVKKKFVHESEGGSKTNFRLKQSRMFGGRIGYSFYPHMMAEVSYTHQPKYRLAYKLPITEFTPGVDIPETPGETRVSGDVFTLNWIYEASEQVVGIKPYVILGAGIARVSIRPTTSSWKNPPAPIAAMIGDQPFFRIKKNTINCFAWQIGGGLSKDLGDNFSVDIGAKLQVVNDIKVKYDTLDDPIAKTYKPAKPIKKTIGVGEFTLGFTLKIPV